MYWNMIFEKYVLWSLWVVFYVLFLMPYSEHCWMHYCFIYVAEEKQSFDQAVVMLIFYFQP